ncbi:MAG TPA: hypothetical protein VFH79_06840 [Candidatus Limnocylindria bacterium]|nr:hypothetical protein [Candidatus Limnocylindria bacterium]
MAETLTESFCERCGTRYEFKAPTRLNPLRKTRGLIGGLKNYVMSQDALGDAVGDAMRSEEERLAAAQLEAFHESFNFCIDCRQYTCLNCWNDDAGRCRSCAPIPGTDDLAERLAASVAGNGAVAEPLAGGAEAFGAATIGSESWPSSDLPEVAAGNGHAPEAWPAADGFVYEKQPDSSPARADDGFVYTTEPEPLPPRADDGFVYDDAPPDEVAAAFQSATVAQEPEPEPVVAQEPEPEPITAWAAAELEFEPDHVAAEEAPAVTAEEAEPAVAQTFEAERPHLRVVAWDEDAAYDLEPEPIVTADVDVEPVMAEEPEPFFATAEPEPEPVVAQEPEPEPVVAEESVAFVADEPEPVVAEEPALQPDAVEPFEPVTAQEPEVVAEEPGAEPVVAEEPEPVAAEQPPAPEPVAPHRIAPISETILRFPDRQAPPPAAPPLAAEDDSPEVAARRAQLDLLGLGDPGEGPVQPTRPSVVPYRSRGATPTAGELAARAAAATGTTFWEASAREVASAAAVVGVQNCGQCGLSLSANARFCRRCGTRQAQSA